MKHAVGLSSLAFVLLLPAASRSWSVGPVQSQGQGHTSRPTDTVPPPAPRIDPHVLATRDASVRISGQAVGSLFVEISSPADTFQVPVIQDSFKADVPLAENRP